MKAVAGLCRRRGGLGPGPPGPDSALRLTPYPPRRVPLKEPVPSARCCRRAPAHLQLEFLSASFRAELWVSWVQRWLAGIGEASLEVQHPQGGNQAAWFTG